MKTIQRTMGVAVLSLSLLSLNGCDTGTGALSGAAIGAGLGAIVGGATRNPAAGAFIGAGLGAMTGAIIGHINERQRAQLQAQSPQTLVIIQHNDQVAQQRAQAPQQPAPVQTPPLTPPDASQTQAQPQASAPTQTAAAPQADSSEKMIPLSVDDIKALDSAGVKKEVIIAEIQKSKSVFTAQDIANLQQADPNIDASVIDCMKKTGAS